MEEKIIWGIIGCGDVAEVKSGPAFQKCNHSELLAVMRRNGALAKDFANRHKVPLWYDNAEGLLANPEINAVYVATPPASHLYYAIRALKAGKHVYLEKPMVLSVQESKQLELAVSKSERKLVVAHYRRLLPMYIKIKELLEENAIGKIQYVDLKFLQSFSMNPEGNWRLNPEVSGGGHFHDMAPHQIDLMYYFFGDFDIVKGVSNNTSNQNSVNDTVNGIIRFKNDIQFQGLWAFASPKFLEKDNCTIYGEKGTILFSFYKDELLLKTQRNKEVFNFINPVHIQQPMIQETVNYFLGFKLNPCSVEEGTIVIKAIEQLTNEKN